MRLPRPSNDTNGRSPIDEVQALASRLATLTKGISDAAQTSGRPSMSLSQFARHLHQERRLRPAWLDPSLFGEAAWDILLDLFASEGEGVAVNVSSACIASDVPATTALRHLSWLEELGLVERRPAPDDCRVSYVRLSDRARTQMEMLLQQMQVRRGSRRAPPPD